MCKIADRRIVTLHIREVPGLTVGSKPNQRTIRVLISPEINGASLTIIHTTFSAGADFWSKPPENGSEKFTQSPPFQSLNPSVYVIAHLPELYKKNSLRNNQI